MSQKTGGNTLFITPKKKFGQNFLVSKTVQHRILAIYQELAERFHIQRIVEIGPGQGNYTDMLLELNREMILIEIDPEAYTYISSKYDTQPLIHLVNADAHQLLLDHAEIFDVHESALFANLPFNVASRILVDLPLYAPNMLFSVVVQREVAQKILRRSSFTLFGAWISMMYSCNIDCNISRSAFNPQPKVTSSLLTGVPRTDIPELSQFETRSKAFAILKLLTRMPNKTLRNNMRGIFGFSTIEQIYKECDWQEDRRLTWDNYVATVLTLLNYYES